MTVRLHNTMTGTKEDFEPLAPGQVRMYTCGPTVWNFAHVGNLRAFLFYDLVRRHLQVSGYHLTHVMNLTDIDDRILDQAMHAGITIGEYVKPYVASFFEDMSALRAQPAEHFPRATEHIPEMVQMISKLIEEEHAYVADGDVYFRIASFPSYGALSHLDRAGRKAGARVATDKYDKESVSDFALWKKAPPGDERLGAECDAPFGRGGRGWHIECSAMSKRYLGDTLDIHAGGVDLIFPHHEGEIAQSEGATGKPFVRYWLHAQHLQDSTAEKMSKRLKNFSTVRDLLAEGYAPRAIRYALLTGAHYRSPLAFSPELLNSADSAVKRLDEFAVRVGSVASDSEPTAEIRVRWDEALNDDLNLPAAVGHLFEFIKAFNARLESGKATPEERAGAMAVLRHANRILDVIEFPEAVDTEVERLIAERQAARDRRDFARSDEIRQQLLKMGIQLDDTKEGTRWKRLPPASPSPKGGGN